MFWMYVKSSNKYCQFFRIYRRLYREFRTVLSRLHAELGQVAFSVTTTPERASCYIKYFRKLVYQMNRVPAIPTSSFYWETCSLIRILCLINTPGVGTVIIAGMWVTGSLDRNMRMNFVWCLSGIGTFPSGHGLPIPRWSQPHAPSFFFHWSSADSQ